MRILQIIHRLYPQNNSGISIYTHALALEISKKHAVSVLAASSRVDATKTTLEKEKITNQFSVYWLILPQSFEPLRWLRICRIYLKILNEFNPDIVHFQHLISFPFFLPYLTRLKHIKIAISLHDYWYICPVITLFHRDGYISKGPGYRCAYCVGGYANPIRYVYRAVKYVFRPYLMRWVLTQSEILLAPSDFVKLKYEMSGFAVRPILKFKYGYSLPDTRSQKRMKTLLRFGYIGGFKPHKGPEVLIKAFSNLKCDAELHLFGWGMPEEISRYKSLAGADPRIFFHGEYKHENAQEVLSSFDILIIPSVWEETFGIAAQEALSLEMPVIAANIGGLSEQIEDGINGFLFKPGDAASLCAVLEYCASNYDKFINSLNYKRNLTGITEAANHTLSIYEFLRSCNKDGAGDRHGTTREQL